jgi:hypothetical protein
MPSAILGRLLLAGACLIVGPCLWGQQPGSDAQSLPKLEVDVLYSPLLSNAVRANTFWMQGGSIQVDGQFWRGLGIEADVSGFHTQNANNGGVGLDLVTVTFGPRYRWSPAHHSFSFFSHALLGEANGFDSIFPNAGTGSSSATSLALQLGGGLDLPVKHRLLLRVFQVDWLRTQLPNADTDVQNNTRLAAGVVIRLR